MLPKEPVRIVEVGSRDGLQNLNEYIETGKKVSLIKRLAESGLKEIQVGSFVHPKAIPQFRDMKEVVGGILDVRGVKFSTLVPNLRGAQNAIESGIKKLVFFFSVSRSHNLNNVKQTPEESIEQLKKILEFVSSYPEIELRVDLATVFGCPFEIKVREEDVFHSVEWVRAMGIKEIVLCDTVGYGNPRQVQSITRTCVANYPDVTFGVHFHNTRDLGLANALAAYESGIRSFDSSIGGLGGCPFAPGATGNVSTEDTVFMFNEMDVETGVDIHALLRISQYLKEILPNVPLTSGVFKAGLPGNAVPACHGADR